ncbi:DUF4982 domain-containing protein [Puniceicoccaceae bacterium K14]|nr:DUF4982 domain-containing protein [Puniceicoccaceae bacterium K14]
MRQSKILGEENIQSVFNFNYDWKFLRDDVEGGKLREFDDSGWSTVSAPHTYNDVDTFAHFQSKNHSGERDQWSGRTWYRKSFCLPESALEKKIFIEFEAVRQLAEVYLNGVFLGKCENGFLPFGFDLSAHIDFSGENVLAVMCDNSFIADEEGEMKWSSFEGGAKHSWNNPHWHPAHGGIYRNVYLHIKDNLHVTLPLFSNLETVGAYVFTPEVSLNYASVGLEVEIRNEYDDSREFLMRAEAVDFENKMVFSTSEEVHLRSGETRKICASGGIENPVLWDPERPHLYRVLIAIEIEGEVVDTIEIPLGIRFWKFSTYSGFSMNGRRMKLQGWGQKSTNEWAGLGAALPDWVQYHTLELMRLAGGNLVRWGHTAGAPVHLKASDQLGLITIQPGVDGEGDLEGHSWRVRANAFRDSIVYFRNHPSILIWEGGNQAVTREHVKELKAYCDLYDPYGKRAYAHRRPSKTTIDFSDLEIGTQGGHKFRDKPVVEGEYNREECPRRVWDDYSPPDYGYVVPRKQEYELTNESFAANQVYEYVQRIGRSSHCGGANWIFSDSTSGGRNDCEVTRAGGIVDAVRLPKEAFFASRALFHPKPQVHLIGHWTYPSERDIIKPFYVVSNCSKVELFINGISKGFGDVSYRFLFIFGPLKWEPGTVEAVAYSDEGLEIARQRKETVGEARRLRLSPMTGPAGFFADGSDIILFDCEALDASGRRCPTFQQKVDFSLKGPGVWRGGYNSGKEQSTNHSYLDLECGINRVAVRSTREAGEIVLVAECDGIESARVVVEVLPIDSGGGIVENLPQLQKPLPHEELILVDEFVEGLEIEQSEGNYIKGFSYSGTRITLPVMSNAEDGLQLYVDRDDYIEEIPEFMRGADYIQTADDERLYEAVDLMDFSVCVSGTLYIAHDDRLPMPAWLKSFEICEIDSRVDSGFQVGNAWLPFYKKRLGKNESITLGSNCEHGEKDCRMYSVLFIPDSVSGV